MNNNNNIVSAERDTCTETVGAASRFFSALLPLLPNGTKQPINLYALLRWTYCTVARDIRHPLVIVAGR